MRRLYIFLLNGFVMTVSALIIRLVGVWFNAYISNKIGTEGMGLYTLVMSVYSLAVTVAISGMGLACTRLVAEEKSKNNTQGIKHSVKLCVVYGFSFGIFAAFIICFFADFIGKILLQNIDTVLSLRAFGICLPFLSVSCILNGYFTSVGRIIKSSVVQFTELFTRILATSFLLNLVLPGTIEYSCLSVVVGGTVSETLSCLYYFIIYLKDSKQYKNKGCVKGVNRRIIKIAIPVALSSYLKSGLSTIKHILIPIQLKKSGLTSEQALSQYGIIQGMVMPVIFFPSAVIISFSSLILPEFSQLYVNNRTADIKGAISKVIKTTMLFSIGITTLFILFSDFLGNRIYGSSEAGYYIRLIAPLTSIIYLDIVVDSILKGINQQVGVVKINIIDTVISIILIYFLLPAYSSMGYIFVIFISEILNGVLSMNMLIKATEFDFKFIDLIAKPIIAAIIGVACIGCLSLSNTYISIIAYISVYCVLVSIMGCCAKK